MIISRDATHVEQDESLADRISGVEISSMDMGTSSGEPTCRIAAEFVGVARFSMR